MKALILVTLALVCAAQTTFASTDVVTQKRIEVEGQAGPGSVAIDQDGVAFHPETCTFGVSASNWRDPSSYEQSIVVYFKSERHFNSSFQMTYYGVPTGKVLPFFNFSKSNDDIVLNREIDDRNILSYSKGQLKISLRKVAESVDTGVGMSIGGWIGGNIVRATKVDYSTVTLANGLLKMQTVRYNALDPVGITGKVIQKATCILSPYDLDPTVAETADRLKSAAFQLKQDADELDSKFGIVVYDAKLPLIERFTNGGQRLYITTANCKRTSGSSSVVLGSVLIPVASSYGLSELSHLGFYKHGDLLAAIRASSSIKENLSLVVEDNLDSFHAQGYALQRALTMCGKSSTGQTLDWTKTLALIAK
jgi:hypothetical protein